LECGGASHRFEWFARSHIHEFGQNVIPLNASRMMARSKAVAGATALQSASREMLPSAARV